MASKFINYRKLKELQEASRNGNEKARIIIDKYMSDKPDMESIDRLLDDYYSKAPIETLEKASEPLPQVEEPTAPEEIETQAEEAAVEVGNEAGLEEVDISADLDRELDGLIDVDEIDDYSFRDYLGDKRKNANRALKNATYFKAFDPRGRESYLNRKKDEYLHSFDSKNRDADRYFGDIGKALDGYDLAVTDMPDDDTEIDVSVASKAYDDFVGDDATMGAFGRSWDEEDNSVVIDTLSKLVAKYGKRNVVAALNTLREDSKAWHDETKGKIENSIAKYGKNIDALLK